jgi:hypothetical protein
MTAQRDLKKIIRTRQAKTGESYTTARAHVMRIRAISLSPSENTTDRGRYLAHSEFHRIWIDQSAAALRIREGIGLLDALNYLVGEKLINFIEATRTHGEFANELPQFVSWIRQNFEPEVLRAYFESIRHPCARRRAIPPSKAIVPQAQERFPCSYAITIRNWDGLRQAKSILLDIHSTN